MLSNLFTFFVLLTFCANCSSVLAHPLEKDIPNTIDLKMGARTLRFEHKKHIKSLDNVCVYCHLTVKGKIDGGIGKDTARILCIPCHDEEPALDTDCKDCHNVSATSVQRK
jgi:hypothetical protein